MAEGEEEEEEELICLSLTDSTHTQHEHTDGQQYYITQRYRLTTAAASRILLVKFFLSLCFSAFCC
jgi:hypothetical protein